MEVERDLLLPNKPLQRMGQTAGPPADRQQPLGGSRNITMTRKRLWGLTLGASLLLAGGAIGGGLLEPLATMPTSIDVVEGNWALVAQPEALQALGLNAPVGLSFEPVPAAGDQVAVLRPDAGRPATINLRGVTFVLATDAEPSPFGVFSSSSSFQSMVSTLSWTRRFDRLWIDVPLDAKAPGSEPRVVRLRYARS